MKILIVTKNWLGDTLFQIPAIEVIKAHHPEAEIVCLAPERCREMLESHPAVSRVIVLDEKREHRSLFAKLGLIARLRREKWDKAYLFHRSRTRAFMTLLAGAGERIGYGSRRRRLLNHPVAEPETPMHQVDYFLELLARAGLKRPENPAYRFYLSQKNRDAAERLLTSHGLIQGGILNPFVCFHLGANWAPKRWPVSHFARLADLIADKWGLPVVLTGSSDDLPLAAAVTELAVRARVISLVGKTSLGELGAVYEKAGFVVSGDSGPMHIASGVGTPVAAIFGPTDPDLTGPRGTGEKVILSFVPPGFKKPWYGELPAEGWLSRLPAEEVFAAIEEKGWVLPAPSPLKVRNNPGIKQDNRTRHNLLITLSNIGDVILTTPVLMALASQFPESKLTVVAGPRAQGLLAGSRFIDKLIIYDKYAKFSEQWRLIRDLRRESYDRVVDLRNTAIPYLVKAGKRSPFLFRPHKHSMRERHLEVAKRMGLSTTAIPTFDFFNPQDEASALQKLRAKGVVREKNWILVAPAAASELKTWRLAGFREVLERIVAERGEDILLVGDGREREIAQPLVTIDPSRIFNMAGETTLPELAALVSRCSLLLSNDSAVMHLGHELNRPVVAIFGPTHHEKYGRVGPDFRVVREPVFCSPCERPRCRFERQACFEDLRAEKVYNACRELLERDRHPEPAIRQAKDLAPERILITRTDRIGDLVLSTPVFSSLRQKFPDAHIACLTFLENREIVAGNPFIDEVILYDKKGSEKGLFGNLRFARGLAAKKFDIVIHLHATNRMHLAGWLAGVPVRVGWDRKCASALTHAYPDLKKEGKKHEAQYNFDLLELLEVPSPAKLETYFPLQEKARQSFAELLRHHSIPADRPWVILNPSASCPSKIWPADRFGQLADRMAEKYEAVFIAIGSKGDRPLVQKARNAAAVPIYDLSGKLSLAMLGVLLKDAALLISNDSGPVHIASAVGTPVISIFGRKQPGLSPARWRPLGENSKVIWKDVGCVECLAHRCQIHFLCLDAISVEDVLKEAGAFGERLKTEKIRKEKVLIP